MKEKKPRWTKERIIARIQELHAQGVQMNTSSLRKNDRPLLRAAQSRFNNIEDAIKAAGLEYQHGSQIWSVERVLGKLREIHAAGVPMISSVIRKHDASLHTACYTYCKSPYRAIIAAGLTPEWTPKAKKVRPRQPIILPVTEPVRPIAIHYNPFEQAFDQHRPNRGVVLNSIASPLGMSEAQRMQQGG